jgi:RHS repeat-associated protein
VPDRTWVFTYTDSNGDAAALSATQRANPPAKVGNQSHAIYSVRDPNGKDTTFEYIGTGNPNVRWRTKARFNRASEKTGFAYDDTNDVTTVTAPPAPPGPRLTKYSYDAKGQVTRITDPANRQTNIVWNADRHVSSITEPGNAGEPEPRLKEFDYDANGYITRVADKSEAIDRTTTLTYDRFAVDGKDVTGKWRAGRTVGHISRLKTVVRPKLNTTTFGYDEAQTCTHPVQRDNLTSVTDGENSKTKFDFNCDGTVKQVTDPRNNVTTISYDANGLPTVIDEPQTELAQLTFSGNKTSTVLQTQKRTTRMGYDADGLLQWIQDPNHASEPSAATSCDGAEDARDYRTCFEYDNFHRPRRESSPKSTAHERDDLLWTNIEFDANDNVTRNFAPAEGQQPVTSSTVMTRTYDAMDRVIDTLGPDDETRDAANNVIPDKTTVRYDSGGRPDRITTPKGNHSATGLVKLLDYDLLDRVTSETLQADGEALRTRYCYDNAGDLRSTTAPKGDRADFTCGPYGNGTHTWKLDYFRDHRPHRSTDPEGKITTRRYDTNGNVDETVDAQGTATTYAYNGRDDLTKTVQKFDATRSLTSKLEYDAAGNVIRKVTPRAWSVNPDLASYDGKPYVTNFTHDALNRVSRVQLPDDTDANTPTIYKHRRYDANGNVVLRTQASTAASLGSVADEHQIRAGFFDPGWPRSRDEGPQPTVRYDYRAEGWQTLKIATGSDGRTKTTHWRHFKDGQVAERDGRDTQTNTYQYDIHNKLVRASVVSGAHRDFESRRTVRATYDGFDRLIDTRQQQNDTSPWEVTTFGYDANSNVDEELDNASATSVGGVPTGGRRHTFDYRQNDWVDLHNDFGTDTGAADDRRVTFDYTDTGWQKQRRVSRSVNGTFVPRQTTDITYSLNGLPRTTTIYKGSDTTALRESHDLSYFEGTQFLNGHRVSDTFVRSAPATSQVKCQPAGGSCVKRYTYDAQDRPTKEVLEVPNAPDVTREYDLTPSGSTKRSWRQIDAGPRQLQGEWNYVGNQLKEQLDSGGNRVRWYRYDAFGNLDCVTEGTENGDVCESFNDSPPSGELVERRTYDDLDRLERSYQFQDTTLKRRSTTVYDVFDRPKRRDETVEPTTTSGTRDKRTALTYRGLSSDVVSETRTWQNAPAGDTDARWKPLTREYSYDATGRRIGMTSQRAGGTQREFTYGYDVHGSVSLLLDDQGDARATYGYTAYGQPEDGPDGDLTDERDIDNSAITPYKGDPSNPYGYGAKRMDEGSGTLDMGARHFSPQTGSFLQEDAYDDALGDLGLSGDPLTQNRYALAGGNPVSFVETDGHMTRHTGPNAGAIARAERPHLFEGGMQRAHRQNVQATVQQGVEAAVKALPGGGSDGESTPRPEPDSVTGNADSRPTCSAAAYAEDVHGNRYCNIFARYDAGGQPIPYEPCTSIVCAIAGELALLAIPGDEGLRVFGALARVIRRGGDEAVEQGAKQGPNAAKQGDEAATPSRSPAETAARACSFDGATHVLMADGSSKPIKHVRVGDAVVAVDPETGERRVSRVTQTFAHKDRFVDLLVDGEVVTTTADHPFWSTTAGRFVRVDELVQGDALLSADGRFVVVRGLRRTAGRRAIAYNLAVEGIHTYHVGRNRILVHNQCLTRDQARDALRYIGVDTNRIIGRTKGREPVYKLPDGRAITRDIDGHGASAFKVAPRVKDLHSKSTRTGSYTMGPDGDLIRVGG